MAPISNPADDAATEALIARLIAEDFGENVDSLRIGGSNEDYEDPLSSYERGVIEGTISDIPAWGDPLSDTSALDPCAGTGIPEYTGEGWDDTMAWEETPNTNDYDIRIGRQGLCEDDANHPPDTNCHVMDQRTTMPADGLSSSVSKSDTTNATHPATCSQLNSSGMFARPLISPMSDPTLPDTVPIPPVLGPQRDTDTSRLRSQSDPSPLKLDRASSLRQATVPNPQVQAPGRSLSEFSASKPFLPVKLIKDEAVGQAIVRPNPTQGHPPYNPAEFFVPRLSAADRYTGLDIDYSSSKGKARARVFDGINVHTDDDGSGDQSAEFNQQMRNFERRFCESADLLDDWLDSEGDDSSFIHIPFAGSAFGRDEQEIRRLEDLAVVDIHVGKDETLESILNDICSPSDQKARVRLEASVSRAVLSTTGTQASEDTTSVEASSTLGTQGSTDSTSFGPSTSSGRSRGHEPPMRSLRQERRRAYYRDKKGWNPKKNDPELLFGVQVRNDDEILSKMPKNGEEKEEEDEKEEVEAPRGRIRKSRAMTRRGNGTQKEEEAEKEDGEAFEGRPIDNETLPLASAPVENVQETEGDGCS